MICRPAFPCKRGADNTDNSAWISRMAPTSPALRPHRLTKSTIVPILVAAEEDRMSGALARAGHEAGTSIRFELRPGDLGEIVRMHGDLYAREHGFSMGFEAYVAGTLAAYDWPLGGRERLWIVEKAGQMAGTIAIVRGADAAAQLRWLLLRAELRGKGLGQAMVEEAVSFSRLAGYSSIFLWTIGSLTSATSVYRRVGFTLTEKKTHELWGATRTEERYDLSLT